MPGALFWFAPLQREGMRSPGRKVGASAVGTGPLPSHNPAGPFELGVVPFARGTITLIKSCPSRNYPHLANGIKNAQGDVR